MQKSSPRAPRTNRPSKTISGSLFLQTSIRQRTSYNGNASRSFATTAPASPARHIREALINAIACGGKILAWGGVYIVLAIVMAIWMERERLRKNRDIHLPGREQLNLNSNVGGDEMAQDAEPR
jgi:hypothetical protein